MSWALRRHFRETFSAGSLVPASTFQVDAHMYCSSRQALRFGS